MYISIEEEGETKLRKTAEVNLNQTILRKREAVCFVLEEVQVCMRDLGLKPGETDQK